jgi:hypothetical protein
MTIEKDHVTVVLLEQSPNPVIDSQVRGKREIVMKITLRVFVKNIVIGAAGLSISCSMDTGEFHSPKKK